jgi:arginine:pyruvate transaminase
VGDTRVLFLNTPGNPTGSHYSRRRSLRELAAYCLRAPASGWSCDEVYSMFCLRRSSHVFCPRQRRLHIDNVVMIDGLSKSHAMSGWRMGWVVAPPPLVDRLGATSPARRCSARPQFIQDASAFALENDQEYVQRNARRVSTAPGFRASAGCARSSGLSARGHPHAGMFIMCDVSRQRYGRHRSLPSVSSWNRRYR